VRALPTKLERVRARYVDFVYQPIDDEDGRVTGIFVEGHDVTAQKEAEIALSNNAALREQFIAVLDMRLDRLAGMFQCCSYGNRDLGRGEEPRLEGAHALRQRLSRWHQVHAAVRLSTAA